jgi:glycosyltransferase involved in cell wall biosynthesis
VAGAAEPPDTRNQHTQAGIRMLERICLINNFNYSKYFRQCLDSVFHQTNPFDRVIIVDDGSTDNSAEIIRSYQSQHRNLTPIFKENGGQLSTLNAAVNLDSQNSQIFLLDADDIYPPDYLQLIIEKCNNQLQQLQLLAQATGKMKFFQNHLH